MKTSQSGMAQIFWNSGSGYSEQNSHKFNIINNGMFQHYEVELPEVPLQSIRIDPIEQKGEFEIRDVVLKGTDGDIYEWSGNKLCQEFTPLQNVSVKQVCDGTYYGVATSDDPSMEIKSLPHGGFHKSLEKRSTMALLTAGAALLCCLIITGLIWACCTIQLNNANGAACFNCSPQMKRNILLILFFAGLLIGYATLQSAGNERVDLMIDAQVSAGHNFEVYTNGSGEPLVLPIIPSKRQVYTFKNIPSQISTLRLDPTDVPYAEVMIYSLQIQSRNQTLWSVFPQQLKEWAGQDLKSLSANNEAVVRYISTSSDPILTKKVDLSLGRGFVASLISTVKLGNNLVQFFCLIGFYVLLLLLIKWDRPWWLPIYLVLILAAGYFLVLYTCRWSLGWQSKIPSVSQAVGIAAFKGLQKGSEIRTYWLTCLAVAVWTCFTAYILRVLTKGTVVDSASEPSSVTGKFSSYYYFGFMAIVSLATFPPLQWFLNNSAKANHSVQYDSQNRVTWDYFRHIGLVPFRDFWYTYGGFYYISSPFYPDLLFGWLHMLILIGICAVSVYRLLDCSKIRSLALFCLLFWLAHIGLVALVNRYFLSISVVFLFALCLKERKRSMFLLWGGYLFYVYFLEVNQLIYAAPGCFVLLLAALFLDKDRQKRISLFKEILLGLVVMSGLVGLYLVYLSTTGALPEYMMFFRTMGEMANYGFFPFDLLYTIQHPFTEEGLYLSLVLILFSLSLWHIVTGKKYKLKIADIVPLAIALIAIFVYQKRIVRWHPIAQTMGIPVAGLAFIAAQIEYGRFRGGMIVRCVLAGAAGLFLAAFILVNGVGASILQNYLSNIKSLPQNVAAAFADKWSFEKVEEVYFAPARFSIDGMNGDELKSKLKEKMKFAKNDDLFVLGDDSYLYIILQQLAPFYITFYNQSILYSQQNTLEWLDKHKPTYVLWRSSFKEFDTVPNHVRVPLIFEKVMNDYRYVDSLGPYYILRLESPVEPVDFEFWQNNLGDTVDLGFIPSRSEPEKFVWKGGNKHTNLFIRADVQQPMQGKEREIIFLIKNHFYRIKFLEREGVHTYHILLDRIWFFKLAANTQTKFEIFESELNFGMTTKIISMDLAKELLY